MFSYVHISINQRHSLCEIVRNVVLAVIGIGNLEWVSAQHYREKPRLHPILGKSDLRVGLSWQLATLSRLLGVWRRRRLAGRAVVYLCARSRRHRCGRRRSGPSCWQTSTRRLMNEYLINHRTRQRCAAMSADPFPSRRRPPPSRIRPVGIKAKRSTVTLRTLNPSRRRRV